MQGDIWNPWHGCLRYSDGCKNCYVYRRDESVGRDPSEVRKNADFNLPVAKNRKGEYKIPSGSLLYTCMTSDFFLEEADEWREEVWDMMRLRTDVDFMIITKRIVRFLDCIPNDWGEGYPNVFFCCTIENQRQWDIRYPVLLKMPIAKKFIACEPLLSDIDMGALDRSIRQVLVGGESGKDARICDYRWVLHIRSQCVELGVPFYFKQTGARFLKDGKLYKIERRLQHAQARKAGINLP